MARMDSLDKTCRHMLRTSDLQPKGSQTRFQPTEAKAESRQFFIDFQQSGIYDNRDHNQCPVITSWIPRLYLLQA